MAPKVKVDKSVPRTSRIGKRPIALPKGVSVTIAEGSVQIRGPKGTLSRQFTKEVSLRQEGDALHVSSTAAGRNGARLQGLVRALVANMVKGVAEGYEKRLELHGTGYRVEVKGPILHFSLGYSHPIDYPLPAGLSANVPAESKGSLLILQGLDKEVIGQAAATIRSFRKPEPYRGKGVRYQGERVREKAGKAGK
jgi:large subunit ribosomal protein L6